MSVIDTIKREIDTVSFEADKSLRINRLRSDMADSREKIHKLMLGIAERSIDLYKRKKIRDREVVSAYKTIEKIRKKIGSYEKRIERIEKETPPEEFVFTPQEYGYICPECKIRLPHDANFCPRCGKKAEFVQREEKSPGKKKNGKQKNSSKKECKKCGEKNLPKESDFCPNCGKKIK